MTSLFTVAGGPTVAVELTAMTPTGPYRLEVTHPAKHLVEYFDTPWAALSRHAELETVLTRGAAAKDLSHLSR
jgi:hypothetical protein